MTDQLFDPGPGIPEAPGLSADRRRTERRKALLAAGVNPATRLRLLDPEWHLTCGDCDHHVAVMAHQPGQNWHKCDRSLLGLSMSAASDIRISWPACTAFRTSN